MTTYTFAASTNNAHLLIVSSDGLEQLVPSASLTAMLDASDNLKIAIGSRVVWSAPISSTDLSGGTVAAQMDTLEAMLY